MDPKQVTYRIISVGRKWIKAEVPEKGWKADIEINEASQNFKPGDTHTFNAVVEHKGSGKYHKVYVYPITQAQKATAQQQKLQSELKRWLGYVEERAQTGYLYENGIRKLREYKVDQFPELNERLNVAIRTAKINHAHEQAKKSLNWIESKLPDYWYTNGSSRVQEAIKQLQNAGLEDEASKYQAQLDSLKTQYEQGVKGRKEKAQQEKEDRVQTEKAQGIYIISRGSGYYGSPYTKGETFRDKRTGEVVTVISASQEYFREDGLSFGVGDDSGYLYSAKVRPATQEEKTEFENKESKDKEYRQQIKDAEEIVKQYRDKIKTEGERPSGENSPGATGYRLADTQTIYGGGDWFTITPTHIWYIRNNGADGDDWSLNNIRTGGAGAIGWRIPYDKVIENDLIGATELLATHTKYHSTPMRDIKFEDKQKVDEARSNFKNTEGIKVIQSVEPDKETKVRVEIDPKKKGESQRITMTEVREVQSGRSERARKLDAARSNKNLRTLDNGRPWARHPDRYDLKGVDTPKKRAPTRKAPGPRINKQGTINRRQSGRRVPGTISR